MCVSVKLSLLLGEKHLQMRLLRHSQYMLNFVRNHSTVLPEWVISFCIPTSNVWVFQSLHILACMVLSGFCAFLKNFSHSDRVHKVVSGRGFNLYFPNDLTMLKIFHDLVCHPFVSEVSVQIFCPFLY